MDFEKTNLVKSPEKIPEIKLSDLDVRGREIKGLEPRMENFSTLPESALEHWDWNDGVKANIPVSDAFVFVNPSGGDIQREVTAPHWRTISKENIKAKYKKESFYTVNTKGVGYLKPTLKGEHSLDDYPDWLRIDEYGFKGAYGLADREDFFYGKRDSLVKRSKRLLNAGLRTELFWYITKLKALYHKGELVPVHDLRKKGVIPSSTHFWPEIGVRLMKTNTRIAEVSDSDPARSEKLFRESYDIYNQEIEDTGSEEPKIEFRTKEGDKAFFKTFAKRMGKNLAVLFNNGYVGWHLHSANTTMAAEIVDIGPIVKWKDDSDPQTKELYSGIRKGSLKDLRDIAYGLKKIYKAGKNNKLYIPTRKDFTDAFLDALNDELDQEKLSKQKVKLEDIQDAAEKIFTAVLVDKKRLGAIKHGFDVTDWGVGFEKE